MSLDDKCEKLNMTEVGRKLQSEGALHYSSCLKSHEAQLELHLRDIVVPVESRVEDLRKEIDNEMKGTHRMPALLHNTGKYRFAEVGMCDYEVLPVEPLHAIGHHINNLFEEIPRHLPKKERGVFERTLKAAFSSRQVKRGKDYRNALLQLTTAVDGRIDDKIVQILISLCEIQEILYSNERSAELILRLYNVTFVHAMKMIVAFETTEKLTKRKLFGQYFHALVCHAPEQFRIIPMPSSNAEDEERFFNFLKTCTKCTSNHHPENVLDNCFIRCQVREEIKSDKDGNVQCTLSHQFSSFITLRLMTFLTYFRFWYTSSCICSIAKADHNFNRHILA